MRRVQRRAAVLTPQALQEIAQVEAEVDRIEAQTIERLAKPPDNQVQQVELLGEPILYDNNSRVQRAISLAGRSLIAADAVGLCRKRFRQTWLAHFFLDHFRV